MTDPLLPDFAENSSLSDLQLVFVLYLRAETKPTYSEYDFNCTLPISYYDIDENSTVALGLYLCVDGIVYKIRYYMFIADLCNYFPWPELAVLFIAKL